MAVRIRTRKGKNVTLLNPAEKGKKFAIELSHNVRLTNNGRQKTNKKGAPLKLTNTQKSYRAGYLQARKDNANAFKSNRRRYRGR